MFIGEATDDIGSGYGFITHLFSLTDVSIARLRETTPLMLLSTQTIFPCSWIKQSEMALFSCLAFVLQNRLLDSLSQKGTVDWCWWWILFVPLLDV